ncbi:phosphoglucosamine mutase [Histomonas meleagridis]|uniref:phosphoglucosamine mutase n=1 Tax=Histomonas meleagridis TaxID=135588 RepID=UPI00355A7ED8|nr:phosphoglucosamine mutase [Histomonas meleagridis]KAH0801414.1 phosphoglucosamine mutase [Histomonas meleagridis]
MTAPAGTLMLSISGIRGIVGDSLTPEIVTRYVASFAELQLTKNKGKLFILGYDTRPAVEWIKHIVMGTLLAYGVDVLDIGVVPTPTVQLIVQDRNAAGGIIVTASHNPQMWCGLKFVEYTGIFLDQKGCDNLFSEKQIKYAPHDGLGKLSQWDGAIQFHIDKISKLPYINVDKIRSQKFKVAVDTINGAGSLAIPQILKFFGCEITELNTEPTGIFAHTPEPIPENLMQLREASKGLDIGIAVDPDSDRCVLIDEKGDPLVEEYTLALAVHLLLSKFGVKAPVCRNTSTSRAIDDICTMNGVDCYGTAIGEVNVAVKMLEVKSIIGGEGNGGVMLEPIHIGRDALVAVALVLQLFAMERESNPNIKISEVKGALPQWRISKMKIELDPRCPISKIIEQWKENIKKQYGETVKLNEVDGLRVDHKDWWVHVRKSNTEPVVRVIGEGHTQGEADMVCKKVYDEFQQLMK